MTVFIYLSRADLDVEVASFIGDLENFRPGEPIDPEAVAVDEQPVGTHTKHYVNSLWILMNAGIEYPQTSKSILANKKYEKKYCEHYLLTLAWCRSTPYIESFLAFSRKFISASAGLIPLQKRSHKGFLISYNFFIFFSQIKMEGCDITCSYGAAPSLSPPAHVSGWGQNEIHWHSLGRVPQARSLPVLPGQCRSPGGHEWQMSRGDDRTGCHPSAVGTNSTWRSTEGGRGQRCC